MFISEWTRSVSKFEFEIFTSLETYTKEDAIKKAREVFKERAEQKAIITPRCTIHKMNADSRFTTKLGSEVISYKRIGKDAYKVLIEIFE